MGLFSGLDFTRLPRKRIAPRKRLSTLHEKGVRKECH